MSNEFNYLVRESEITDSSQQSPIYFSGGFGYDRERNAGVLRYIKTLGHETLPALPDHNFATADPRFTIATEGLDKIISRWKAMRLVGTDNTESISANYQQERAEELAAMLEQGGHNGIRAIFQSADVLNGLKVMHNKPELISHAILAYPAGISHRPRFLRATWDVSKGMLKAKPPSEITAANNFEVREDGSKITRVRAASNFVVAASVALSQQHSLLSEIRNHDSAPGIALVLGSEDGMIKPERVITSLESPTDVDYILITDKPHGISGRKDEINEWLKLFPLMADTKATRKTKSSRVIPLTDRMLFFGDIPQEKRDIFLALAAGVDAKAT